MSGGRLRFWSAVATAIAAAAAFGVAITTPPRSGPFCVSPCVTYPYTAVASFVPRDYIWMYPALLVAPAFVVLVACVNDFAGERGRVLGQLALICASMATVLITADYFIQLTVMQPSLLKGETEGLSPFSQYNPHGVFIALEDAGYLVMALGFLFAGELLGGASRLERMTRWVFITGAVAAVAALIGLSVIYGADLEYRFEVAVLSIDWLVLIATGILLSVLFRPRAARSKPGLRIVGGSR